MAAHLRAACALALGVALLLAASVEGRSITVRHLPPGALRPPPAKKTAKETVEVILFGDSYTDTGRVEAKLGLPNPEVYYKGRFSNGPNWADYLEKAIAAKYKVEMHNYAWGAATSCPDPRIEGLFPFVKDLGNQTAAFLADVASGAVQPPSATRRVLHIQWTGGNDIQFTIAQATATNHTPTPAEIGVLLSNIVKCRIASAVAVARSGVAKDVVLFPAGSVWLMPAIAPAYKGSTRFLMDTLDGALDQGVAAAQQQLDMIPAGVPGAGAKLHTLDSEWMANAFTSTQPPANNTLDACIKSHISAMFPDPDIKNKTCTDPQDYAFWDNIHITTRYMEWFAVKGVVPALQNMGLLPKDI